MKLKKAVLSSFVVLAFAFYAVYQRLGGGSNSVLNLSPDSPITSTPTSTNTQTETQLGIYTNGEYIGANVSTIFGDVRVAAVISHGRITNIKFLKFPNDRTTSINISNLALPRLKTEAIAIQSAKVDMVSGATQTSEGFIDSLASALAKAK